MVFPLEEAVVKRITKVLDRRGAWWVKTTGVSKVGCPDLLVCYKGRFLAIEVKRHRDSSYQLTRKQQHELERVKKARGIALVAYGVEDVEPWLNGIDSRDAGR